MTTEPKTRKAPIVQALARHMAAQPALDAVPGPEDYPEHLREEESGGPRRTRLHALCQ